MEVADQHQANNHTITDIGVAAKIGSYSDAILTEPGMQWLFTSGTPGLPENGVLPKDIKGQSELAWTNILSILHKAGMSVKDIVKVTQYLTQPDDVQDYAKIRKKYLGDAKPASMLLVIPQLVWPDILVEVEIIAAKKMA